MENAIKPQKIISQKIAEFFFMLYMITLYIFVDKTETVIISKVVFVIFAVFTTVAVLRSKSIHIGRNVMTVYIAFTWMFATVFWAQNVYNATYMIKTMWQLFIQFFLVYNLFAKQPDAYDKLLKSLYVSGVVLIGYSIYLYGFSAVLKALSEGESVRLGAEINQENSFGMMNATTFMVAFYYLFYKRRFKFFHIITVVGSFVFAMASGSRKALLMMCTGVVFLVLRKYKIKHLHKAIAIGTVLVIVLIIVINLPVFDFINSRMDQMFNFITGEGEVDSSSNLRWKMIVEGWNAFKDRFLNGYGANNYRNIGRFKAYAHNNFIEILVDFGAIGFFLYYLIYFMAFRNLWKSDKDAGKALICVFLVRFIMEIAMVTYYSKLHWIVMAFFLINHSELTDKKNDEEPQEQETEIEIPKKAATAEIEQLRRREI